ncbi:MAG: hypothetical protein WCO23_01945 [bacterium]
MKKNKIIIIIMFVLTILSVMFFKFGIYQTLAESDQDILFPKLGVEFAAEAAQVDYPGNINFNTKIAGVKRDQAFSYTFWYDCTDESTDYAYLIKPEVCGDPVNNPTLGIRFANVKSIGQIPKRNYPGAGIYTAKVLIERGTEKVEKRLEVMVKPAIAFSVNGSTNVSANIEYGGSVNLKWNVSGLSDKGKCVSSWDGEKGKNGEQKIAQINDNTNKFTLTCSEPGGATGTSTIEAKLVPKIIIQAKDSDITSQGNSEILPEGTMAFNAAAVIIWNSYGSDKSNATPCTGFGSDASWDGKLFPADGSFRANKVTTNSKYGLRCSGLGGVGESSFVLKIDQGNCSFGGNNNIHAAVFCEKKLVVINDSSNVDLTGAFVAKKFNIADQSKNIRFYYDPKTEINWPPGFRYFDLSQLNEVANK